MFCYLKYCTNDAAEQEENDCFKLHNENVRRAMEVINEEMRKADKHYEALKERYKRQSKELKRVTSDRDRHGDRHGDR